MDMSEALRILCQEEGQEKSSEADQLAAVQWVTDQITEGEKRLVGTDEAVVNKVCHMMLHMVEHTVPPDAVLIAVAMKSAPQKFASLLFATASLALQQLGYQPPDLASALFPGLSVAGDEPDEPKA